MIAIAIFPRKKTGSTAEKAASNDYANFWGPRILAAETRGLKQVSNFRWWSNGRCSSEYRIELYKLLGPLFTVERVYGQFGGKWTRVSWK